MMKPEILFTVSHFLIRKWRSPLPVMLSLLILPSLLYGQSWNFQEAGNINPSEFLAVSSDQEATSVFRQTFGKKLGFTTSQRAKRGQKEKSPSEVLEITDEISQFMTSVIISIRAGQFQTDIQNDGFQALSQLSNRETPQSQWLLSKTHSNEFSQLLDLSAGISSLSQDTVSQPTQPPPHFSAFSRHFDQTYPQLVEGEHSWISILERDGSDAIADRFKEFWEKPSNELLASEHFAKIPPDQQHAYGDFYLKTRLLPVFLSHLIAKSIQLQANANFQAEQSWMTLTKWKQSNQKIQALTRLCGMWQWTVHNHQNHQDHKMTMAFSPSSQPIPGQPQPDVIIMNGDTVYLKWVFPSGYQEDSLLLSNRDQRLEGTFRNSRGPHGSISGKRLSHCRG